MFQEKKFKSKNLTAEIEADLRSKIEAKEYKVGDKLPTELALGKEYTVSRTVVREAIAGLRAAGLIASRRGSGVFVVDPPKASDPLFQLNNTENLPIVLDTLELRSAVEIEAAGLAAKRSTPGQIERIHNCHNNFKEAIMERREANQADFLFHQAITSATNNSAFVAFLEQLGRQTIPRKALSVELLGNTYDAYMAKLLDEHGDILRAIESHSVEKAMQAMREHLHGSLARYADHLKLCGIN